MKQRRRSHFLLDINGIIRHLEAVQLLIKGETQFSGRFHRACRELIHLIKKNSFLCSAEKQIKSIT